MSKPDLKTVEGGLKKLDKLSMEEIAGRTVKAPIPPYFEDATKKAPEPTALSKILAKFRKA